MAATGAALSAVSQIRRLDLLTASSFTRREVDQPGLTGGAPRLQEYSFLSPISVTNVSGKSSSSQVAGRSRMSEEDLGGVATSGGSLYANPEEAQDDCAKSLMDYIEEVTDLNRLSGGSYGRGPPRWFSPVDCGGRACDSPLLLYLPGIDGTGFGLSRHHKKIGKIFEVWCLHIPASDRTPAEDLVGFVERTVRSENQCHPNRPIYIVAESVGACLALDVAARNPTIDIVLILVNPATSFRGSLLQALFPLLEHMPDPLFLQNVLGLREGDPSKLMTDYLAKGLPRQPFIGELSKDLVAFSSFFQILPDILPKETLVWKLRMLQAASASANSHLHAVRAQTLLLASGQDQWLPSAQEGERLRRALPKCEIRRYNENGHFLFLEDDFDLVTVIKSTCFYRRRKYHDYSSDYIPPTPFEFRKVYESSRWLIELTSPVILSTLEDGKVIRGLAGIPSEGPTLYVGYHMLLGLELFPMVIQLLAQRNILLRGMAHPMMFAKLKEGNLPEMQSYDVHRLMGAVPVDAINFFKLFSSNSHVLLYPGGVREALHRKGEEYKLIWPEEPEFVRMAARFGAKIVPFGVVGEDDIFELVLDYEDQMKIPPMKAFIEDLTSEVRTLRTSQAGELGNQDVHMPGVLPKLPGRFYFYFGKPIETAGLKQQLRDKAKAQEVYGQVKLEVESCIAYLKEKREGDAYRSLPARVLYHARHGLRAEVPTFHL